MGIGSGFEAHPSASSSSGGPLHEGLGDGGISQFVLNACVSSDIGGHAAGAGDMGHGDSVAPDDDVQPRGVALVNMVLPNGKISFYPRTQQLEAACRIHAGCKLKRTTEPFKGRGSRPSQGRPMGLLSAWLNRATEFDTHKEHINPANFPDFDARVVARIEVGNCDLYADDFAMLCACERPLRSDELDEPENPP